MLTGAAMRSWDYAPGVRGIAWTLRIALSVVYGIDLAIRGILARRPVHYVLANPLALASVLLPLLTAAASSSQPPAETPGEGTSQ